MNQSLSDLEMISLNNLFQKYETCRQQSLCYLLIPPPRPPIIPPRLFPPNFSSTLTNHRQSTDSFFIILGILITLTSTCLLLVKFQLYHKLRHRRTTNKKNDVGSASFLHTAPTSYDCLTPLTTTTLVNNQYPLSTTTNNSNLSLQQHSTNIYEEIRDHSQPCCCCSCSLAHYQQKQYISNIHQLMPYYYTCEPLSPSKIVCQNCLSETLYDKQRRCHCQNFFVPTK